MSSLEDINVYMVGSITDDALKALKELNISIRAFVNNLNKRTKNKKYSENEVYEVDFDSKKQLFSSLDNLKLTNKPDVVFSCLENYVVQASWIAEYYKINGTSEESALKASDKYLMREAFKNYDPSITPDFVSVHSIADIFYFAQNHDLPLVLKPTNLVKSLLVTINKSINELSKNYNYMMEEIDRLYKKQKVLNFEPNIILEEYLDGTMHSVKTFVDNEGETYSPDVIVDLVSAKDVGIQDNYLYARKIPSSITGKDRKKIIEVANKGAKALGLTNIICHTEIMLTKKGPKIIEINPRMGGNRQDMFLKATGINLYEQFIRLLSGHKPTFKNKYKKYQIKVEYLPDKVGKYEEITNLYKIRELSSFEEIKIRKDQGEIVGPAKKGFTWIATLSLVNEDQKQLIKDYEFIKKQTKVKVVE